MNWETFGHEHAKSVFDKQLAQGKFSHAYLFIGPSGLGKKKLAKEFAKNILGAVQLNTSPDFQIIDGEEAITVEAMQEFIASLRFKPFSGSKKVAIINNAENLSIQSGNALLKTIEEPTESTVIILISSSPNLLSTLVSRCQTFFFHPFPKDMLQHFAAHHGLAVNDQLLRLSFGCPGRLVTFSENKNAITDKQGLLELFGKIKKMPAGQRLVKIPELAEQDSAGLREIVCTWLLDESRADARLAVLQSLSEAYAQLLTNKNKKLILQSLFLSF